MTSVNTPQQFELKIWVKAQPRDVFASWIRADQLAKWFQHTARAFHPDKPAEDKAEASTGDAYEWTLAHGHRSRGRYLDVRPDEMLVRLSFGADTMSTSVRLEPADGGTWIRLTHEGLPPGDVECYADVKAGWTFFLANLKAFHEHGVDLREHSPERIRRGALNI